MKITQADVMIAARTVYGEARGETDLGKRAVAAVLINRWKCKTGQFKRDHTLAAACLRWLQFSAWNPNDPNQALMQEVDFNDKVFLRCLSAVIEQLLEPVDNIVFGCKHYHHKGMEDKPRWAKGKQHKIAIGHHYFYDGIK